MLLVLQRDKSQALDFRGITGDVRARYEDAAHRSRVEARAWYKSKVRKPGRGRVWGQILSSDQRQTQRNTPPTLLIRPDLI